MRIVPGNEFGVVGKDEVEGRTLSLKSRKGGELGSLSVDEAIARMTAAQKTYMEPHEVPTALAVYTITGGLGGLGLRATSIPGSVRERTAHALAHR